MDANGSAYPAAWAGLEIRHLLALNAVVENGTFSGAAEQLGYTQPAVSQQVGTLERIVGTPLFERPGGPRPVRLTTAGQMLLIHARAVLARVNSAATDLRALSSGERGELRDPAECRHQGPSPTAGHLPYGMAWHRNPAARIPG